jgi:hypothetical protein
MNSSSFSKLAAKAFIIIAVSASFFGCRVGDDDPAISLRSRDNRLKGEWKLTKMNNVLKLTTFTPGSPQTETNQTVKYDGFTLKVATAVNGVSAADTAFGYSYNMEIEDDGKLTYDYTVVQNGLGIKSGGEDIWYWLSADKSKSKVYLNNTFISFGTLAGNLPINLLPSEFEVKGLKNKELTLTMDRKDSRINADGSYQNTVITSEATFELK